jgi:hypothetical protein
MEKLHFDLEVSGDNPKRDPEFVLDLTGKVEEEASGSSEEGAISFSVQIVKALEDKVKTHNKSSNFRINIKQLKEVYVNGAKLFEDTHIWSEQFPEKNAGEWAMARIHMFLRMRAGNKVLSDNSPIKSGEFIDISATWCPTDDDFKSARDDIKNYELNYNFDSIEELYINEGPVTVGYIY